MASEYERIAWANLGPGLANIFQNYGQQRERRAEFDAKMAQAELQRRDDQEYRAKMLDIDRRTLEFQADEANRRLKIMEEEAESKKQFEDIQREAAAANVALRAPRQAPPRAPYQSATSPPPGTPRGTGEPLYESEADIVGALKNRGLSDEVIASVLRGEQGALPITEKPKPMSVKEALEIEKTVSEIDENRAQAWRIWNPVPNRVQGPKDPKEPSTMDILGDVKKMRDLVEDLGGDPAAMQPQIDALLAELGIPISTGTTQPPPDNEGGVDWEQWLGDFKAEFDPALIGDKMGLFSNAESAIQNMLNDLDEQVGKIMETGGIPDNVATEIANIRGQYTKRLENLKGS